MNQSFSRVARRFLLGSILATWAVAGAGCVIVVDGHEGDGDWGDARCKETRHIEVAHQPATALIVSSENGSVEIDRAPQQSNVVINATVRAKTQERLAATRVVAQREGSGELRVSVEWPDAKRRSGEGCSFEIATPDARGVTVNSSNGSLTIAGLSGEARLVTSNGRITVTDQDGGADVRTSNGRVVADRVHGDLTARTSNGSVSAHEIAGLVDVDTSNGGVEVRLADDSAGPVRVDTSNAHIDLEVGRKFTGVVSMGTSNGSARFSDASGRVMKGRDHLEATIGEGGPRSTARTSNGTIEMRVVAAAGAH